MTKTEREDRPSVCGTSGKKTALGGRAGFGETGATSDHASPGAEDNQSVLVLAFNGSRKSGATSMLSGSFVLHLITIPGGLAIRFVQMGVPKSGCSSYLLKANDDGFWAELV